MRDFIGAPRQRLTVLELQQSSSAPITAVQATELTLAVKAVGQPLERNGDQAG